MKKICVVGAGYVGLVTATCLADLGNEVICVEIDQKKLEGLQNGVMPIFEPGLAELVARNMDEERLRFTASPCEGVQASEVIFVAVGTPARKEGGVDLHYVEAVANEIATHMNGYKVIVNKSTVPAGTGAWMHNLIRSKQSDEYDFDIVSNPEFLREGSAIFDFKRPDRIVLGCSSLRALHIMRAIYDPLSIAPLETPIISTNVETAEMIKYASNAFLATKISFINEIANVCERVGADIDIVAKGMGMDERIGPRFLHAGIGYGGSCFPKDTEGLLHIARQAGYDLRIVQSVVDVNSDQPLRVLAKLRRVLGDLQGRTIGLLGLSFKPNTDDLREAPSKQIVDALAAVGANIRAYDPVAGEEAVNAGWPITVCRSPYSTVEGCDAMVVVTEWDAFRELDLERIRLAMAQPVIIDGRNIYDPQKVREAGFHYDAFGRGSDPS